MIPLLVFYMHVVFISWLFTRRWQDEGLGEGILAVFFAALIFFVGWSMTSFIVKLLMTQEVLLGIDRDSASLLLLTGVEGVFYYFYLREEGKAEVKKPTG
jgi:hypothetical protein